MESGEVLFFRHAVLLMRQWKVITQQCQHWMVMNRVKCYKLLSLFHGKFPLHRLSPSSRDVRKSAEFRQDVIFQETARDSRSVYTNCNKVFFFRRRKKKTFRSQHFILSWFPPCAQQLSYFRTISNENVGMEKIYKQIRRTGVE